MSELERAFITTADKTYKKVEGKDGRTYHFKDGTPIKQQSFNAAQQHIKFEGQKVKVAVPSDKGPGYERKEIDPIEASALGQELQLSRDDVRGQPRESVRVGGESYDTDELVDLNNRIIDRHGSDVVFRYT